MVFIYFSPQDIKEEKELLSQYNAEEFLSLLNALHITNIQTLKLC